MAFMAYVGHESKGLDTKKPQNCVAV